MKFNIYIHLLLFAALSLVFSSCEKDKGGIIDSNLEAPFISSVIISQAELNLDTTTSFAITRLANGTYRITDSLFAEITNPAPAIRRVHFKIYAPGSGSHFISGTLNLSPGTTSLYSNTFTFIMDRSDAGTFRIEVYAENTSGNTSNVVQIPLVISRNNSTPNILLTVVPDSVYLPPGDSLLIKMTASVSDSDGVGDINEVFFYSLNSSDPTRKFFLLDDGNVNSISGDEMQGDGTYTITVKLLDQGNIRRTFEFEFYAMDRQGSISSSVLRFLTIY